MSEDRENPVQLWDNNVSELAKMRHTYVPDAIGPDLRRMLPERNARRAGYN